MLVICFLVSASSCSLISKEYGLRVEGKFLPDLHGRFFPDGLDEKSLNEKVIVDIDFNCNRYHRFMVGPPILPLFLIDHGLGAPDSQPIVDVRIYSPSTESYIRQSETEFLLDGKAIDPFEEERIDSYWSISIRQKYRFEGKCQDMLGKKLSFRFESSAMNLEMPEMIYDSFWCYTPALPWICK